jgi:hypothetical protein
VEEGKYFGRRAFQPALTLSRRRRPRDIVNGPDVVRYENLLPLRSVMKWGSGKDERIKLKGNEGQCNLIHD